MRKIYKGAIKDIYFNKSRSMIIILAIVIVITFPMAFIDTSYNLERIIIEEQDEYRLTDFNIIFDHMVNDTQKNEIDDIISNFDVAFSSEGRVHMSTRFKSSGKGELDPESWIRSDIIADNNPSINKIVISEGRAPSSDNEIMILRTLAYSDNISIGDELTLYSDIGPLDYKITGYIDSIEYTAYKMSQIGLMYMSYDGISRFADRKIDKNEYNSILIYFEEEVLIEKQREIASSLEDEIDAVLIWFVRETSFRRALLDGLKLTSQYMYFASIFIFLVAAVIIFVILNRYVNEQKTTLGAIYSFGVRRTAIFLSYFLRMGILFIIASILGIILSQQILRYLITELSSEWGLIGIKTDISTNAIIFTFTAAILVTILSTTLAVFNLLRLTPYEAMRGRSSDLTNKGILFRLGRIMPTKLLRLATKNLSRNRTRTILTVLALIIALTFSLSLTYTEDSLGYTIEDYYSNYVNFDVIVDIGFDNSLNFTMYDEIGKISGINLMEYYILQLVQFTEKPEEMTYLLGYSHNTSMIEMSDNTLLDGRWFEANSSEIVISKYLQGNLGYEIGDDISFNLLNVQFNVTIVGVNIDFIGMTSFSMDLNYISSILKSKMLLPPSDREYTIANYLLIDVENEDPVEIQNYINNNYYSTTAITKDNYKLRNINMASSQSKIILLMVILGFIVGVAAVFTTLFIAIIERERELALLQVFGNMRSRLFIQILFEALVVGLMALIPVYYISRIVAERIWMPIVSDTLFQMKANFAIELYQQIVIFTIVSLVLSVIPSFISATSRSLVSIIREE